MGQGVGGTWSVWCFRYLRLKKNHYSLFSHASKHSRHFMKRFQVFLHKQKLNSKLHQKNYREHDKQIFINAFYFFTYLAHIYSALIFHNQASPQKEHQDSTQEEAEDWVCWTLRCDGWSETFLYQPVGLQNQSLLRGEEQEDKRQETSANLRNFT